MVMGGNSLLTASERPIAAPSRTRAAASATASRIGRFVTTSPEIRSASSTGTELADRMLKVRVKRAVLKPRDSLPTMGMRNCDRCQRAQVGRIAQPAPEEKGAATTATITM